MKANELRLGNYIYNGLSKIITVTNIDSDGVNGFHDESVGGINYEYGGRIESIYRITLTEEWLLKFGFIIHEDGYITCPNGRQWILHLDNDFEFEALNIIVIYVHQLQNLFFSLTGEELTIKNKTK